MEDESRNKNLSRLLIALGIIMSIGGIIAIISSITGLWSLPEINEYDWLFGAIVGGFNIWIFGILVGRKHRWDQKIIKNIFSYKILLAVGLIGHLATAFGWDFVLIKAPKLTLNQLFIYLLCGCLGLGISYLIKTQKGESNG